MNLGATLFKLTGFRKLSEATIKIYCGLRALSALLRSIRASDVQMMDDIHFSDKLELIERRVISLEEIVDETDKDEDHRGIFSSFRHAALIYIYSDLRGLPKSADLFGELSERLRVSLQVVDLDLFSQGLPTMIIWILLVGAGAAVKASSTKWYALQLANLKANWEAIHEGKMKFLSEEFLWPEKQYDQF